MMPTRRRVSHAALAGQSLGRLITETRRAFHRLARAADTLHDDENLTAGERAVLVELFLDGPRTVPEMAKARPVSRQHIQTIVNPLLERGLVEAAPNPRHRRSGLIALTGSGRTLAARVLEKEASVLGDLATRFTRAELDQASRTLRRVIDTFDGPAFLKLVGPTGTTSRRRKSHDARTIGR